MLIKRGAWLWVISPLPYVGRSVMVVGMDACKQSKDSPTVQALCATMNPYFTMCYSTWRRITDAPRQPGEPRASSIRPPGQLFKEAVLRYFVMNDRLPDTLVVYRSGVSENQEMGLLENEIYHPEGGVLQTLVDVSSEVDWDEDSIANWKQRLELVYIVVRRSTSARLCTEDGENMPSGSYVDDEIVAQREERGADGSEAKRFDFYMVSQSFVIGTAKPVLYSVLYNTVSLPQSGIIQLTYRLCSIYQTFSGMVSVPAPLKYAARLVSFLSKCAGAPEEPPAAFDNLKPWLYFI
jgi:eukaryotic translation initiation factor 2C